MRSDKRASVDRRAMAHLGRNALVPFTLVAVAIGLASCVEVPRDAPKGDDVRGAAFVSVDPMGERVAYALVKLSPSMMPTVNANVALSAAASALAGLSRHAGTPDSAPIRVGDIIAITIFETQAGGLFLPQEAGSRSGNYVALPNQQVDAGGFVTVPYAGNVKVEGLSPKQVSSTIARSLKSRAIEPQVVVAVAERRGNQVSVLGEVNQPSRFAIDPGGVKLSGAIAHAGGPKFPDYDTDFTLERAGSRYNARLNAIFQNPRLDVQLQGQDVVYLAHDPNFVMVFGATLDPTLTSITRRVTFESSRMNLAEAVAKAGGLNTARADPASVFVFRKEPKTTLHSLGVDTSPYGTDMVPTVYSVDFATADGVFLSDALQLRNHDIIVVSEARYTDYTKIFALINQVATVPTQAASIAATAAR